jgi:hypothetical protein
MIDRRRRRVAIDDSATVTSDFWITRFPHGRTLDMLVTAQSLCHHVWDHILIPHEVDRVEQYVNDMTDLIPTDEEPDFTDRTACAQND